MAKTVTPPGTIGNDAPDFKLPATDGRTYTLADCQGANGTLVMFICNHCPYVKAVRERIVRDTRELMQHSVASVAIMSNDPTDYPEDSFEQMQKISERFNYPFPYLLDATQETAKRYGAVCTPDFFGYGKELRLCYRGRLDNSGMDARPDADRELFEAMKMIAATGTAPDLQKPSIGCSIKWL